MIRNDKSVKINMSIFLLESIVPNARYTVARVLGLVLFMCVTQTVWLAVSEQSSGGAEATRAPPLPPPRFPAPGNV